MEVAIGNLIDVLVLAVFAISFNLLAGYTGQLSIAHGAFGAFGGYALAYVFLEHGMPFLVGAAIGVALATVVGTIIGLVVIRLTSEWLVLMTFAVQVVVVSFATTSTQLGGSYGLQGVSGLSVFGHQLDRPSSLLPLFAVSTLVVYLLCRRLGESPYGRVLRGIREDEVATRSLGKNVAAYKLTVFALTAGMAAVGGVLLVVRNAVASPAMFDVALTTVIVSAVIIGGTGNLVGSMLAAAMIVFSAPLLEYIVKIDATTASLWQLVIYGTMMIAVLFWRPQGLLPEGFSLRRRKPAPHTAVAAVSDALEVPRRGAPAPAPQAARSETARQKAGEVVLEVRGLCKRFGGIIASDELDLTLHSGTISALVGPNGAGKTTLFNILTGAIPPDRGEVRLRGQDVRGMPPERIARVGLVRSFQEVRIMPRLSVLENVIIGINGHPGERIWPLFVRPMLVARREREARYAARRWLAFVGLEELADVRAGNLAFGQQKLLAIARALATDAEVLLLDEPASGVDVQWVEQIVDLIHRARAEGRTICIVEHNLEIVERVADNVFFMELGRITTCGTFAEVTSERRLAEAYFGT